MKHDAKPAPTRSPDLHARLRPVTGRHNGRLKELRTAFRRAQLTPQGECAIEGVEGVLKLQPFSAAQILDRATGGPIIVAAGLQDPGNLGTILRSAEAFGAAGVFLTEGTVSPYNSKVPQIGRA